MEYLLLAIIVFLGTLTGQLTAKVIDQKWKK